MKLGDSTTRYVILWRKTILKSELKVGDETLSWPKPTLLKSSSSRHSYSVIGETSLTYQISLEDDGPGALRQQFLSHQVAVWDQRDVPWTRGCLAISWPDSASSWCNSSSTCCRRLERAGRNFHSWLLSHFDLVVEPSASRGYADVTDRSTWRVTFQSYEIGHPCCEVARSCHLPSIELAQTSCQVWR